MGKLQQKVSGIVLMFTGILSMILNYNTIITILVLLFGSYLALTKKLVMEF